jgi:hypothetical protein
MNLVNFAAQFRDLGLMQLQEGWEVTSHPDTAAIDKITGEILAGKRK